MEHPSSEAVSRKRGPKAKVCEDCRLNNAKRICTHRALPKDVDKENLALAPAQMTRSRSGVLLSSASSSGTTLSSSSTTTPLAALSNNTGDVLPRQEENLTGPNGRVAGTPSVVEEQMITRRQQKVLRVKLKHRSIVNSLNIARRWKRKASDAAAAKDLGEKEDSVLATWKQRHAVDLASVKDEYARKLLEIQGNHEAALGDKDKTIRQLEADLRNIQRGCLVHEKVEQLEKELVETQSKYASEVRDFRRQVVELGKSHELEQQAMLTEKDKEIKRLNAEIGNITRGAILDKKVEELEKELADKNTDHSKGIRRHRGEITALQSKHTEEIGRMLAAREERTKILNQNCDELRKSLEASRIEVGRLRLLEKEHNWQNRLLALNLAKRASDCVPEYDATAMKWTSDEGEKACQTPKDTNQV